MLEFLKGVVRGGNKLPPILPCVVEANSPIGILPRIQLAVGGQTIIVYTLHDKVLIRQVMRMVSVRRLCLYLDVGARATRTQEYLLQVLCLRSVMLPLEAIPAMGAAGGQSALC